MLSPVELFTILRVLLGALFVAYGAHKLFGWFGGHGLHANAYDLAAQGVRHARTWTRASALLEFVGGLLLLLGLLTPVGAAAVFVVALVSMLHVQASKGFWNARGGYEYHVVLLVLALLVALAGPGPLAVDALIRYPRPYKTTLVVSMGLAVIGTVAAVMASSPRGRRLPRSRQTT